MFAVGLAVLLSGFGGTAQAKKIALVIGNAAYPGTEIPVARQDAVGIAPVLKRNGFNVELRHYLSAPALQKAIQRFAARAASDRVDLLFQRARRSERRQSGYPARWRRQNRPDPLAAPGTEIAVHASDHPGRETAGTAGSVD